MMKYYKIDFSLIGRYAMPHTIELTSKEVKKYLKDNSFFSSPTFFDDFPEYVEGKLLKRKNLVDYMETCPFVSSLNSIISDKFKTILEDLNVNKNEYFLRQIRIKNFEEQHYYLLFIPYVKKSEIIFPECEFRNDITEEEKIHFKDCESWSEDHSKYTAKKVVLTSKYKNNDIIFVEFSGLFFSERIVDELFRNNIVGLELETKGYFYADLVIKE